MLVRLVVFCGSVDEVEGQEGAAHMLQHVIMHHAVSTVEGGGSGDAASSEVKKDTDADRESYWRCETCPQQAVCCWRPECGRTGFRRTECTLSVNLGGVANQRNGGDAAGSADTGADHSANSVGMTAGLAAACRALRSSAFQSALPGNMLSKARSEVVGTATGARWALTAAVDGDQASAESVNVLCEKEPPVVRMQRRLPAELLSCLYGETRLPNRPPAGTPELAEAADFSAFQSFYDQHYRPDNMCLLVVHGSDVGVQDMTAVIEEAFGNCESRAPADDGFIVFRSTDSNRRGSASGGQNGIMEAESNDSYGADCGGEIEEGEAGTPVVGTSAVGAGEWERSAGARIAHSFGEPPVTRVVIQHTNRDATALHELSSLWPLSSQFSGERAGRVRMVLSFVEKEPLQPLCDLDGLRRDLIDRVIRRALRSRTGEQQCLHKESTQGGGGDVAAAEVAIEWLHEQRADEGCSLSVVTIVAGGRDRQWRSTVAAAVHEVRRLALEGFSEAEVDEALAAILTSPRRRASTSTARCTHNDEEESDLFGSDNSSSCSHISGDRLYAELEALTDTVACGNSMLDSAQKQQALVRMVHTVDVESVNARLNEVLQAITDFLSPDGLAVLLLRCPAVQRDVDSIGTDFDDDVTEEAVMAVLEQAMTEPLPSLPIFKPFMSSISRPSAIAHAAEHPGATGEGEGSAGLTVVGGWDRRTGILRAVCGNGVKVCVKPTAFDPGRFRIRLSAHGGRALGSERLRSEPDQDVDQVGGQQQLRGDQQLRRRHAAVLALLADAWVGGGAGGHSGPAVARFLTQHGLQVSASCGAEALTLDLEGPATGIGAAFEVLHLLVDRPGMGQGGLLRARRLAKASCDRRCGSLEGRTEAAAVRLLAGPDDLILDLAVEAEDLEVVESEELLEVLAVQLRSNCLEIGIVGEVGDGAEQHASWAILEPLLQRYVCTLRTVPILEWQKSKGGSDKDLDRFTASISASRRKNDGFRLMLSAEPKWDSLLVEGSACEAGRSYAVLCAPCINRWGVLETTDLSLLFSSTRDGAAIINGRLHSARCLTVALAVANVRLRREIVQSGRLAESIELIWTPMEVCDGGVICCRIAPSAGMMDKAVRKAIEILDDLAERGIGDDTTLDGPRRQVADLCRSALTTNGYWLDLLGHLQSGMTPKTLDCLHQIPGGYEAITAADVDLVVRACLGRITARLAVAIGVAAEPSAPVPPHA